MGVLNSLFQVALHLPSLEDERTISCFSCEKDNSCVCAFFSDDLNGLPSGLARKRDTVGQGVSMALLHVGLGRVAGFVRVHGRRGKEIMRETSACGLFVVGAID